MAYFDNAPPEQRLFKKLDIQTKYRLDCDFYDQEAFRLGQTTQVPRPVPEECYRVSTTLPHKLLIWGDSHAQQFYYGLRQELPGSWEILITASSGCPATQITQDSATNYCKRSNFTALSTIASVRPDVVLIAQNSGHDPDSLLALAQSTLNLGAKKVIIAGPVPHWQVSLPTVIVRHLWTSNPTSASVGLEPQPFAENRAMQTAFENR